MKYRPEIDGMRALAVVPVILFHAGFASFSGGFVGVDIFFVISGYLITTILIDDIEKNQFSILRFYERRARRILPALFFVMLACLPFAWAWMLPGQMVDFSQSVIAVSFFSSNILFWRESDYFAPVSEEKPLLHTWSLAVEEQYYVVFPIFLFLAWRFGKRRTFWTIVALAALSLGLSEWGARNRPLANFYLAPSRAWELFAGSIAAFGVRKQGVVSNDTLSILGLVAIVFSIFAYDEATPFPSLYSLVPVTGVVLVVLFGGEETYVARLLRMKLFVGIGLISYSAYLWHQPLFAFARIRQLDAPSLGLLLTLVFLAFGLAAFSWRFVEQPFRKRQSLDRPNVKLLSGALAGLLAFVVLGFIGTLNDGFPDRFTIPSSVYESIARTDRQTECFGKEGVHERDDWLCTLGERALEPDFMVFGDSHALSFLPAFDNAGKNLGLSGVFVGASGCTPFLGIYALRPDQTEKNCHSLNQRVFGYVQKESIDTVFLVARWTYYTDGGYDAAEFSYIGLNENSARTKSASRRAFEVGLEKTVEAYANQGVNLVVIPQVPQQRANPLDLYAGANSKGIDGIENRSVSRVQHRALQAYVTSLFDKFGVTTLPVDVAFCDDDSCQFGTPAASYYFDDDHLSLVGSAMVEPIIEEFIADRFLR